MENLIKIGYFRRVESNSHRVTYIPYKEYLSWSEEKRRLFKEKADKGEYSLYCACCRENRLELSVTSNLVIRVKSNKQQQEHMESCPKSIYYSHWNDSSENGIVSNEDSMVLFNIALPSVLKSVSTSSSSSSSSSSSGEKKDPRTGILDMVKTLNMLAWEKQTFSKKKEIKEANRENRPQAWQYKTLDEFNRLIFGVSNDVLVRCKGEVIPFIRLCYRKDLFYACNDWRQQWFVYAVIEKISELKKERKYQYITVRMPSQQSNKKAVIRVETEHFIKMMAGFEEEIDGTHRILAGYICRKSFKNDDGSMSEWMHFLKGVVIRVSENGLYCENEEVARVANRLSDNRILYKRPYFPLENYGSEMPTFLIECLRNKDIVVDVVDNKMYEKRVGFGESNEEFRCVLLKKEDSFDSDLRALLDMLPKIT